MRPLTPSIHDNSQLTVNGNIITMSKVIFIAELVENTPCYGGIEYFLRLLVETIAAVCVLDCQVVCVKYKYIILDEDMVLYECSSGDDSRQHQPNAQEFKYLLP